MFRICVYSLSELFDNYMQQDAHEFLNYLLNTIADLLQEEKSQERQQNGKLVQNGGGGVGGSDEGEGGKETQQTWVHEIFQGTLTNETRCLNCEAVSLMLLLDPNIAIQTTPDLHKAGFKMQTVYFGKNLLV